MENKSRSLRLCRECSRSIPEGVAFCRYCGADLALHRELEGSVEKRAEPNPVAVMVISRCMETKQGFTIDLEKKWLDRWRAKGGTVIPEARAKRAAERGSSSKDQVDISRIDFSKFKCPVCGANSLVRCPDCGKLTCWKTKLSKRFSREPRVWTCAWCGNQGEPTPGEFSVSGVSDF